MKAKKTNAWSDLEAKDDEAQGFGTVLELPPVNSPQTAVKVAIAAEARGRNEDH
ncbi:MAG: hypothetical protein ABSA47_06655 [Verrucomicrobiota bacterium]|jgi:hypothetical protein